MGKRRKRKRSLGNVDAPLKTGRAIMSFLFPPIGFVTWAIHNNNQQKKANTALKLAAISTGLGIVGRVLYDIQKKK